ncbi:MAG: inositol 2-dehydrogenase [Anaerolineaceae bacterium]|nr:inositol 2-dehydrogenase [Anaerolineaceae bacterium]
MGVKLGVLGAGRIAQTHLKTLATRIPDAGVEIIADPFGNVAAETAQEFGIPRHTKDHREVLEDESIDAVIICTTTNTHAPLMEESARAGKHIFCEKPIDLDVARIDQALAAVKDAGVRLQVGFNRRFDPNHRRVRQAIEAGEIGDPHILHIISRDPYPAPMSYTRNSGGIFVDMTVHDFDLARYLIGSEIEEIYATGTINIVPELADLGDLDTTLLIMRFQNGVLGMIDNSRKAVFGYDQRVEVFGSGGSAKTDNRYDNAVTISDGASIRRDPPYEFFMERYTESFAREMESFVRALTEGTPIEVDGYDGRMPVVMGVAAFLSHERGRPVRMEEIENAFYNPLA